MSFVKLNIEAAVKPFVKIYELDVDRKYRVLDMYKTMSPYGVQVIVILENCKASLPERYSRIISDEEMVPLQKTIQEKEIYIVNKGLAGTTTNIEFVES